MFGIGKKHGTNITLHVIAVSSLYVENKILYVIDYCVLHVCLKLLTAEQNLFTNLIHMLVNLVAEKQF